MTKSLTILAALALIVAPFSLATAGPWYVPGGYYNGGGGTWTFDAGNEMFDDGVNGGDAVAGDGIFTATVTSTEAVGKQEFKFALSDWSVSYHPSCNLWVYIHNPGDVITFTYDTNTYGDGWVPTTQVYWSSHMYPPGTVFEVIGSAAETGSWGSGVAGTLLGNVFTVTIPHATPGTYEYKWRAVGDWDVQNFGGEGAVPCGFNGSYETTVAGQNVLFELNTLTGRMRALPEDPVATEDASWGSVKGQYR
jgi:hypothetical protein